MPKTLEVKIPDIGDFTEVAVIEVMVKPGDTLKPEDPLITLESDKATMDVPSPAAGKVKDVKLKVGDKVAQGTLILLLETAEAAAAPAMAAKPAAAATPPAAAPTAPSRATPAPVTTASAPEPGMRAAGFGFATDSPPPPGQGEEVNAPPPVVLMPGPAEMVAAVIGGTRSHASPSVRAFARELGVDVAKVRGTGPKGRITKEDVQGFVKAVMAGARPAGGGLDIIPWPKTDFSKFGSIEARPLTRIRKISGANLARNWVMIPHVTQFDEADITGLERYRVTLNKAHEKDGVKVTVLAFLIKAAVEALKKFPEFNSSLDGENLIIKHYYHIGFAADTPNGLVVPVIRNADRKSVLELAREAAELAAKAREGKLTLPEMQGGCFSISSLGGIGGTLFTPIINAPEVAILGVSRAEMKQKWDGKRFAPRLMLPLSLSYDHRVIDGASGARFTTFFTQALASLAQAAEAGAPKRGGKTAKPRKAAKKAAKKKSKKR
ncbi:dihydrolipoamide acetyltransferase [Sulfuricaulis limicola]|uniref:Acetyltransferase component of pyruvate dehydrogenase complex n=1 Tax=Sulfuricaulis limicola TaxID=1620215 RepID=A0A1B4XEB9_9GAMM|nr:dihydrolipoyllysine-residue acetyltransferase [Sulfuricaulis limicola]BAV33123.1 dihydrolipoamide acetyltransferase [Sulfuricaulis limicola]